MEFYTGSSVRTLISPALQFLFYLFLALAADHNVIGKHHGPWSFLSDPITIIKLAISGHVSVDLVIFSRNQK